MAVKIRLKRTGTRNNACHRIAVADVRAQRDGKVIEYLGLYDPRHKEENIDMERAKYWLSQGAQPSETVKLIIKRAEEGRKLSDKVKVAKPSKKAVAKAEAEKKAAADAAAKAEAEKKAAAEAAAQAATEAETAGAEA
ncbi:MAG: 30S ribosomal protein S16 [Victivallales bacterium]|jgi:small subunit ribosomal protein S16|nr:30S ribosomal protein S16 [Victivallales bacterium]